MILLVRHGHAGDKAAWDGPDHLRPLTASGWQESSGLLTRLGGFDIGGIVSSPATRCLQTVEPLAHERFLPVTVDARLSRDAHVDDLLALVRELSDDTVLCTHGELIGALLAVLRESGARIDADAEWPKGSTWLLDTAGGRVTSASYLPPLRRAPYSQLTP